MIEDRLILYLYMPNDTRTPSAALCIPLRAIIAVSPAFHSLAVIARRRACEAQATTDISPFLA